MKDIKFRCYGDGEMQSHEHIKRTNWSYDNLVDDVNDGYIIMQYTGLKDKNGVEIYEFDLLDNKYEVVWGSGKYVLHDISIGDIMDCTETTTKGMIINGNRFENAREYEALQKNNEGSFI